MSFTASQILEHFALSPHPEGGFFRETYRSLEGFLEEYLPDRFGGDRCFSTAIYYLLPQGTKSKLHRIAADEVWHFYQGDPLTIFEINSGGHLVETTLGPSFENGQVPQHTVSAGHWFGALPSPSGAYSFVGCTVAPGFDFADFEMASRLNLVREFPQHRSAIELLTDP